MISFFTNNKNKKVEDNQSMEEVLKDFSFKGLYKKSSIQRNVPTNLQSVFYVKGEENIVLLQNGKVTGHS